MPLVAGLTAAMGGYLGVIRAIDELRVEVRTVQVEHRAAQAAIERRIAALEELVPRDAATRRDLVELEERLRRTSEHTIERHERSYHEGSSQ